MTSVKSRMNAAVAAFVVALAALGIGYTAVASAESSRGDGSDALVSPWPEPKSVVTSGNTSLTNDGGMPEREPGSELQIGLGLFGLALLLLTYGLATMRKRHAAGPGRGAGWPRAAHRRIEVHQRP